MTYTDHEAQALAFLAFNRKRGGDWRDNFGAWARSKAFTASDYLAIRSVVVEELTAGGIAPSLADLLRPGAA
jgi:hypothetical protein